MCCLGSSFRGVAWRYRLSDQQTIELHNGDSIGWSAWRRWVWRLDAQATAATVVAKGRSSTACAPYRQAGRLFETPPVWYFDFAAACQTLDWTWPRHLPSPWSMMLDTNQDGRAMAKAGRRGAALDVEATLAALSYDPAGVLATTANSASPCGPSPVGRQRRVGRGR